jgi:hypothetical protein
VDQATALTLSIDCFYGIPAVKCALTGSFVLLARQVLLHGSGTVPDVTSYDVSVKMSDTTYGPLGFTASWSRQIRGLGVTSHDVSIK